MNNKAYYIKAIRLENFRNYTSFELIPDHKSVVITGKNGVGKTSVLEAISMLSPGKGMRGASHEEMTHNKEHNWIIYTTISIDNQEYNIGTGLTNNKNSQKKRIIKVNGENITSSFELAKYFSVLWLTPQTDHNFLSSSVNKRKFLDRMVYNFDVEHAALISEYEKKVKERSIILKLPKYDSNWLDVIEKSIAELNLKIYVMRNIVITKIRNSLTNYHGPFPKFNITTSGSFEELMLQHNNKTDTEICNIISSKLKVNRKVDTLSGKTNFGTHRSNFEVYQQDTNMPISNCSTGEQKAMLIALLLHQIYVKKSENLNLPVLLLDEITAHLDQNRRQALMETIRDLEVQVWLTGTEQENFSDVNFPAIFAKIVNGKLV